KLQSVYRIAVSAILPWPEEWRCVFRLLVAPALLVIFYRFFTPETPRFLLSQGKVAQAEAVLDRLHYGKITGTPPASGPWLNAVEGDTLIADRRPRLRDIIAGKLRRRTLSLDRKQ